MNLTLKALGALLTYPDDTLVAAVPELRRVLEDEVSIPPVLKPRLRSLLDYLQTADPWDLQESYVAQFDTGRSTSLHLFEHVHGESKDRGQAMVDLKAQYEEVGLTLVPDELPDFLPAFLEYTSVLEADRAAEVLGDCLAILQVLGDRLTERQSPWAAVFPVLCALARPSETPVFPPVQPEKSLDAEWAEEPAFGTPSLGVQGVC